MQKKIFIVALIPLFSGFYTLFSPVHAASPTPTPSLSPSPTPADDNTVTDNLKKRLQEALGTTTVEQSPLRAYVGVVRDVIKDTVVIEDKDGKKDLRVQDDTVILRSPGNSPIKSDSIRIDDSIIAIGLPAEADVLTAKRLIVSTTPFAAPAKVTAIATIKKIDKTALTLTIGDKDQKVALSSKTILKSTVATMQLTDLSVGDTVIYTATLDDNDQTATIVMRIKTASL